jgi:hypothetical protein
MDAWRTACLRLPVRETANEQGLVELPVLGKRCGGATGAAAQQ